MRFAKKGQGAREDRGGEEDIRREREREKENFEGENLKR